MNLWDYQKEAIGFLKETKRAYFALEPGMGKTLTSLAAARDVTQSSTMVVAELNEIENSQNFKKEVDAHFQELQYYSLREHKLTELSLNNLVCGINPDALAKLPLEYVISRFSTLIVDEATMAKNASTARFKRIHEVAKGMEHVILLSGTPMLNGAAEIYAPLLLMNHSLAGVGDDEAQRAFETIFAEGHRRKIKSTGNYFRDYVWYAKGTAYVRELRYLIRDSFFFKRKQDTGGVFKKKFRKVERVDMSFEWLAEYQQAWNDYIATLKYRFGELTEKQFAKKLGNITELQRLIENSKIAQINSKWKGKQVVEDIKNGKYGNQRIVIFSAFIETDQLIQQALTDAGIGFKTFEEITDWKNGSEQVIVGRIKAHGKGSNLPEASVALFVDMSFVPSENIQAENRIDRPEQTRDMQVVYYITENETVDEHIRNINREKTARIEEFMRPLTEEEILMMPEMLKVIRAKYPKECRLLNI